MNGQSYWVTRAGGDRLTAIADAALAQMSHSQAVEAAEPDWEIVDRVDLDDAAVLVLRHRNPKETTGPRAESAALDRPWAIARVKTTLGVRAQRDQTGTEYSAFTTWHRLTAEKRRQVLDSAANQCIWADDLPGLWAYLMNVASKTEAGTPPDSLQDFQFEGWMNTGFRLSYECPDGASLRNVDWVRLLLSLSGDLVQFAYRCRRRSDMVLREKVTNCLANAVIDYLAGMGEDRPPTEKVRALADEAYEDLGLKMMESLRRGERSVTAIAASRREMADSDWDENEMWRGRTPGEWRRDVHQWMTEHGG